MSVETIIATPISFANYSFVDKNNLEIAKLIHTGFLFNEVTIKTFEDETELSIKKKNFWKSTLDVTDNNEQLLYVFKQNWKGQIVIHDILNEEELLFKQKTFFSTTHAIFGVNDEILVEISTDFSWKKLKTSYEISFDTTRNDKNLVFLSLFLKKTAEQKTNAILA